MNEGLGELRVSQTLFYAHFFPKIKNRKGTQMQERGKIWSSIILQSTLELLAADTY